MGVDPINSVISSATCSVRAATSRVKGDIGQVTSVAAGIQAEERRYGLQSSRENPLERSARLYGLRKNALYEGHGFSRAVKSHSHEGFSPEVPFRRLPAGPSSRQGPEGRPLNSAQPGRAGTRLRNIPERQRRGTMRAL